MATKPTKPRSYFAKFLATKDEAIDYSESPPTTSADWENAEILLPVDRKTFKEVEAKLKRRRAAAGN